MLVSDHARMLAVAPGGWDRCVCKHCRLPESKIGLRKSARTIERRLLADEIADALTPEPVEPELLLDVVEHDEDGTFMVLAVDGFAAAIFLA
jgi:hypothetical protein